MSAELIAVPRGVQPWGIANLIGADGTLRSAVLVPADSEEGQPTTNLVAIFGPYQEDCEITGWCAVIRHRVTHWELAPVEVLPAGYTFFVTMRYSVQ